MNPRRKIGVFNHGGTKNLGDETLLAAVIHNVRLRLPDAEIIGFTIDPDDTRDRHGIPSFPIRHSRRSPWGVNSERQPNCPEAMPRNPSAGGKFIEFLKKIPGLRPAVVVVRNLARHLVEIAAEPLFLLESYRRLKGVELLLVAGGQQLSDGYGGAWGFPYTLYKWTLLAQLTGTKVAILSVGAGPLDAPLSKFFCKGILKRVNYRSYRDSISSRMMESLGIKGSHPVVPDLVYSMRLPEQSTQTGSRGLVVAVNPVPFFDERYWPEPDPQRYQDYVRKIAVFAEWLSRNSHSVLFFPTQVRADILTMNDIQTAMDRACHSLGVLPTEPVRNLEDLVSRISRADFVVANRYHGILISLAMNKPVLAIAYHEKSRELMEHAGLGEYVLNIGEFKPEEMIERFERLKAAAPAIKREMAERIGTMRMSLEHQYDAVFGLIGVTQSRTIPNGSFQRKDDRVALGA